MLKIPKLDSTPIELWQEVHAKLKSAPFYALIQNYYHGKIAKRSGLPYLNHIHEGVYLYTRLFGWQQHVIGAFCVHPIFQSDHGLNRALSGDIDTKNLMPEVIILAMEYRAIANAYISTQPVKEAESIQLSSIEAVNQLLIVDKIQNKKDFLAHIYSKQEDQIQTRAREKLRQYFDSWLDRLGVSQSQFVKLTSEINAVF